MKQLIKSIAPEPVWVTARETVNWARFAMIPKHNFNAANLCPASSVDLDTLFSDSSITEKWDADHAAIAELYGNEDTMGGVNPGDRKALYFFIMGLKPKNVLEVGTHIGASTLHIARALKQTNKDSAVTSVDITDVNHPETGAWKSIGVSASPEGFAKQLNCAEHIKFHTGPCLNYMKNTDNRYDFIFLDGDHTAHAVYQEVSAALSVLNKNGTILLHDYYPEAKPLFPDGNIIGGPFLALKRICKELPDISVLPLGELPWPTKQGVQTTSLALVVKNQ